MDKEFINHLLAQIDVMETECGEYDGESDQIINEHEYIAEAEIILKMLAIGSGVRDAMGKAFEKRFQAASLSPAQREEKLTRLTESLEAQQRLQLRLNIKLKIQSRKIDVETVNFLLWQADLMNTSCNFNEGMEGEYSSEARGIAKLLAEGVDFRIALKRVFDERFWEGCLDSRRENVEELLKKISS